MLTRARPSKRCSASAHALPSGPSTTRCSALCASASCLRHLVSALGSPGLCKPSRKRHPQHHQSHPTASSSAKTSSGRAAASSTLHGGCAQTGHMSGNGLPGGPCHAERCLFGVRTRTLLCTSICSHKSTAKAFEHNSAAGKSTDGPMLRAQLYRCHVCVYVCVCACALRITELCARSQEPSYMLLCFISGVELRPI